jgi:hypothetical protein
MNLTSLQMKNILKLFTFFSFLVVMCNVVQAQDTTARAKKKIKLEDVSNTFAGNLILDNQTVMVPVKHALDIAIQHRFGTIENGYKDMYGVFAPANIRISASYTPLDNLQVGVGLCKDRLQWDGTVKYSISRQHVNGCPVSLTYFGDIAIDSRPMAGNFVSNMDRYSYFNQLILGSKISEKLSLQVAPSVSYFNNIPGYLSADGTIKPKMYNAHLAVATSGCYMVSNAMGIMVNYDQPLTQHPADNPHPNLSIGLQIATITHTFQIFIGNYQSIIPQNNNVFNQNDYTKNQFLLGFNITKRFFY